MKPRPYKTRKLTKKEEEFLRTYGINYQGVITSKFIVNFIGNEYDYDNIDDYHAHVSFKTHLPLGLPDVIDHKFAINILSIAFGLCRKEIIKRSSKEAKLKQGVDLMTILGFDCETDKFLEENVLKS